MRSKRMLLNSLVAVCLQIVSIFVGLVIPRLIIGNYGSSVNGLVNSITQFLSYIILFEAGIGGVSRAILYKPLLDKDLTAVSGILKSTEKFYRRLASYFFLYVVALSVSYPLLTSHSFDYLYTGSLILIIAVTTFAQYYFGITYSVLLFADQKNYIGGLINIITAIMNMVLTIVLIRSRVSIHLVKLGTVLIFVLRPLFLRFYVHRFYQLKSDAREIPLPRTQKNGAVFHNIAWFIRSNVGIVVLTFLSSLVSVSIYSLYRIISVSLSGLVANISSGAEAAFGNILAENNETKSNDIFGTYLVLNSIISVIVFSVAGVMVMPFIRLYSKTFSDANYYLPSLGIILLIAEAIYCLRKPYHDIITAAGRFMETRFGALIETLLNVVIAVALVSSLQMVGVSIAVLIAILFRTGYFFWYLDKNIVNYPLRKTMSRFGLSLGIIMFFILLVGRIEIYGHINSYLQLIFISFVTAVGVTVLTLGLNLALFRNEMMKILMYIKIVLKKR